MSQVDDATARGEVKDTKRAGYFKSLIPSYCRTPAIVNEDEIGRESQSENDRRFLACIQRSPTTYRRSY